MEAVDLAGEGSDLAVVVAGVLAHALVDLRREPVRVHPSSLRRLLSREHVLAELQEILLGGDAGDFLYPGTTGEGQREEKDEPSPPRQDPTRA